MSEGGGLAKDLAVLVLAGLVWLVFVDPIVERKMRERRERKRVERVSEPRHSGVRRRP